MFSLRPRLLFIVLLAVLPAVALIIYTGVEERAEHFDIARARTVSSVSMAVAHERQETRFARDTLATIAHFDEILDESPFCADRLRTALDITPRLTQLALIRPDGSSPCSVPGPPTALLVSGSALRRTFEAGDFTLGDYAIDPTTGKVILAVYFPVPSGRQPPSALAATLDLTWFEEWSRTLLLPSDSASVIFDETGRVLTSIPEQTQPMGAVIPDSPLVRNAVRGNMSGEITGLDNVTRFYSIAALDHPGAVKTFIAVGLAPDLVFGVTEGHFARNLVLTFLVTVVALLVAWVFGDIFIVRRVRSLLAATQRLTRGEVPARTGMTYGVSELSELARAFDQMAESVERQVAERTRQLQAANSELEAFAYSVSHDLRTPLSTIEGLAKVSLEGAYPRHPELEHFLNMINENARAMQDLVDSLLKLSRLSRQPLEKLPLDPRDLVNGVLDELLPLEGERHIEITVGEMPTCNADPVLLKQVWTNLISNALKFTRPREVARVEIGSKVSELHGHKVAKPETMKPETLYYVRDNGVGFDMAQADRLFQVFQRLHGEADFEGTGVGLALVRRIVRRHGGEILAEAEVDKGATFLFTLGE